MPPSSKMVEHPGPAVATGMSRKHENIEVQCKVNELWHANIKLWEHCLKLVEKKAT